MAADSRTSPEPAGRDAEPVRMRDEEDTARSTPGKDLMSAVVIAAFAAVVAVASIRLEVPDTRFTAPGLLPFITALALLGMSLVLGLRAVRAGALERAGTAFSSAAATYLGSSEERRAWLLGLLVLAYVVLVAQLSFELPVALVGYALSAFEVVSVFTITILLKLFWRASLLRCFLVASIAVEVLALAFRFGFNMIMPEVF